MIPRANNFKFNSTQVKYLYQGNTLVWPTSIDSSLQFVEYIDNSLDPHAYIDLQKYPDKNVVVMIDCSFGELTDPSINQYTKQGVYGGFFGLGDTANNPSLFSNNTYAFREKGDWSDGVLNIPGYGLFAAGTSVAPANGKGQYVDPSFAGGGRNMYYLTKYGMTVNHVSRVELESPYLNGWVISEDEYNRFKNSASINYSWSSDNHMFLFAMNDVNNLGTPLYSSRYMKVYKVEFWRLQSGETYKLTNELYPAINEGNVGLYDATMDVFYSGNGRLSYGSKLFNMKYYSNAYSTWREIEYYHRYPTTMNIYSS